MSVCIKHKPQRSVAARIDKSPMANLILRWWTTAIRNWQRRKMIAALKAMDGRILLDIGIHPAEIESFVDGLDSAELRMVPIEPEPETEMDDPSYADLRRTA